MSYSPFFKILHDETSPVGLLGRGTHCSVLRTATWHDEALNPLQKASYLDFAVIWDEDHDTRIVQAFESMYFEGLMAPVQFIGERKGSLTVLASFENFQKWDAREIQKYAERVEALANRLSDPWTVVVDTIPGKHSIINDTKEKVALYLQNVQMLWELGVKKIP